MTITIDQDNLIASLGIQDLPDERKIELIEQVSAIIEKRILLRFLQSLNNSQRAEFNGLIDAGVQEPITAFMQKYSPDLPAWLEEEISKARQELAGLSSLDQ